MPSMGGPMATVGPPLGNSERYWQLENLNGTLETQWTSEKTSEKLQGKLIWYCGNQYATVGSSE